MLTIIKQAGEDKDFRRRRRIGRANRKVRDRRENSLHRDLRKFWTQMGRIILSRVAKIGKTGFIVEEIFRPQEFSDTFKRVVNPQFTRTVFAGISFEADFIRTLQPQQNMDRELIIEQVLGFDGVPEPEEVEMPPSIQVDLTPRMRRQISSLLKERSVGVWRKVGPSLRDSLERTILKGLDDGDPFEVMTKRLRKKLAKIKNVQPAAIARTETTYLMNKGGQIEREELQIPSKEWVSTLDSRNRGADPKSSFDHLKPDGQIVATSEPFTVSGEFLMHPADGSLGASVGNLVNCRCASIASLKDSRNRGVRRIAEPVEPPPPPPVIPEPAPSLVGPLDAPSFVDVAAEEGLSIEQKIFHRIGNNPALKEKTKRVIDLGKKQSERFDEISRQLKEVKRKTEDVTKKKIESIAAGTVEETKILRGQISDLFEESGSLIKKRNSIRKEIRDEIVDALAVPEEQQVVMKLERTVEGKITKGIKKRNDEAGDFLKKITSKKSMRGSNQMTFDLEVLPGGGRAFARASQDLVALSSNSSTATHVHELSHLLENTISQAERAVGRFRKVRIDRAGTKTRSLNGANKTTRYRWDERGNEDEWIKAFKAKGVSNADALSNALYTGKNYVGRVSTEVVSMGVELLFNDPIGFATRDPEFFKFILGLLDGTMSVAL